MTLTRTKKFLIVIAAASVAFYLIGIMGTDCCTPGPYDGPGEASYII